jgi:hypothetical protein
VIHGIPVCVGCSRTTAIVRTPAQLGIVTPPKHGDIRRKAHLCTPRGPATLRAAVTWTSFSFEFSLGAEVGQTSASWRSCLSSEVFCRRPHRLQFAEILSHRERCNLCHQQSALSAIGLVRRRSLAGPVSVTDSFIAGLDKQVYETRWKHLHLFRWSSLRRCQILRTTALFEPTDRFEHRGTSFDSIWITIV